MNNQNNYNHINEYERITKYLEFKGVKGKYSGKNTNFPSICCDPKDIRLGISTKGRGFHCFKCHSKGYSLIQLIQAVDKVSKEEAQKIADDWQGNKQYQPHNKYFSPVDKTPKKEPEIDLTQQNINRAKNLDKVINYLKGRGISEKTAKHFNLGSFYNYGSYYVNIPHYKHSYGQTWQGSRIDRSDPSKSKKWNPSGLSIPIFNWQILKGLKGNDVVFITDGQFDAMSFYELGYNAISLNGMGNGSKLIRLLNEKNISKSLIFVLAPDNSEKEQELFSKLRESLGDAGYRALVCDSLAGDDDVNNRLQFDIEGLREDIKSVLSHASQSINNFFPVENKPKQLTKPELRANALNGCIESLRKCLEKVTQSQIESGYIYKFINECNIDNYYKNLARESIPEFKSEYDLNNIDHYVPLMPDNKTTVDYSKANLSNKRVTYLRSAMGTAKTSKFIVKWCKDKEKQNKRILFIVDRSALTRDVMSVFKDNDIDMAHYQDGETIRNGDFKNAVTCVHSLLNFSKNGGLDRFDAVVIDEASSNQMISTLFGGSKCFKYDEGKHYTVIKSLKKLCSRADVILSDAYLSNKDVAYYDQAFNVSPDERFIIDIERPYRNQEAKIIATTSKSFLNALYQAVTPVLLNGRKVAIFSESINKAKEIKKYYEQKGKRVCIVTSEDTEDREAILNTSKQQNKLINTDILIYTSAMNSGVSIDLKNLSKDNQFRDVFVLSSGYFLTSDLLMQGSFRSRNAEYFTFVLIDESAKLSNKEQIELKADTMNDFNNSRYKKALEQERNGYIRELVHLLKLDNITFSFQSYNSKARMYTLPDVMSDEEYKCEYKKLLESPKIMSEDEAEEVKKMQRANKSDERYFSLLKWEAINLSSDLNISAKYTIDPHYKRKLDNLKSYIANGLLCPVMMKDRITKDDIPDFSSHVEDNMQVLVVEGLLPEWYAKNKGGIKRLSNVRAILKFIGFDVEVERKKKVITALNISKSEPIKAILNDSLYIKGRKFPLQENEVSIYKREEIPPQENEGTVVGHLHSKQNNQLEKEVIKPNHDEYDKELIEISKNAKPVQYHNVYDDSFDTSEPVNSMDDVLDGMSFEEAKIYLKEKNKTGLTSKEAALYWCCAYDDPLYYAILLEKDADIISMPMFSERIVNVPTASGCVSMTLS